MIFLIYVLLYQKFFVLLRHKVIKKSSKKQEKDGEIDECGPAGLSQESEPKGAGATEELCVDEVRNQLLFDGREVCGSSAVLAC